MTERTHVTWHEHQVSGADRERVRGHRGCLVWLTGLSGSGKSTLANAIDHRLHAAGCHSYVLDGDNIRHGLNAAPEMLREKHGEHFAQRFGLGFSAEDREENIRRIGCVGELFVHAGLVTLTAFVSPYRRDRDAVRQRIEANCRPGSFIEVYVDAPLEVCEARDPKGLYRKARAGELRGMTGIDDPYEPPNAPELHLDSARRSVEQMTDEVIAYLRDTGVIP